MASLRRRLNPSLVFLLVVVIGLATPVGLQTSRAADQPVGGSEASTLQREPLLTPQEIGDGTAEDLLYADPTENLSQVAPPEGNSTGTAQLEYPLVLPKGRGMTPELALAYESGGGSSWAGLGWLEPERAGRVLERADRTYQPRCPATRTARNNQRQRPWRRTSEPSKPS